MVSVRRRLPWVLLPLWLVAICGCAEQVPQPPAAKQEPEGCRVSGRIVSTAWRGLGGGIERSIVSAWALPERERVEEAYGEGEPFELRLPPGKYRLVCSANGTRGATFEVQTREITIAENQDHLDVGELDLPISKTTALYGKPAPELNGIIAWQDTPPLALADLQGKVIVLDFFGYYCSICHAHKPDLVKLRDKYERQGLVVLAVHDSSLKTFDAVNAKMDKVLRQVFAGDPPHLPMALDGAGKQSVFEAYGIYAVPAVILIDQRGRIVRRYHHAGKPELEDDVRTLLAARSRPIR
jgi:thiol-disulfide isomerase/thioredoxin